MKFFFRLSLTFFLLWCTALQANSLFDELIALKQWQKKVNDSFPITFNYLQYPGIIAMPSARMTPQGTIGVGFANLPYYQHFNLLFQPYSHIETSFSLRTFKDVDDPALTPFGYGNFSDKGVNVKAAILLPEESGYRLPGLAFGIDDFNGTMGFYDKYIVMTKVWLDYDFEASIGYGGGRINGIFGGAIWRPLRHQSNEFLLPLAFVAEYDSTDYSNDRNPEARREGAAWNWGIHYQLGRFFNLSASYMRGESWAVNVGGNYNFGSTKGVISKFNNPPRYRAPINREPIGMMRTELLLAQEIAFALQKQELLLRSGSIVPGLKGKSALRLVIANDTYHNEWETKRRIIEVIARLVPREIEEVFVVIEANGLMCQQYHFPTKELLMYADGKMGQAELNALTPIQEVSHYAHSTQRTFYQHRLPLHTFSLHPSLHSFLGTAYGKYLFTFGLRAGINGYIGNNLFYDIELEYPIYTQKNNVIQDRFNTSRLIQVFSDNEHYEQLYEIKANKAYLQHNWNIGRGLFARCSAGYYELMYGGLTGEFLFYPARSPLAFGFEYSLIKKRRYSGLGFQKTLRRFEGTPSVLMHDSYTFLKQYFLNAYCNIESLHTDIRISLGKFLAKDIGVKTEVGRYFPNGLRVSVWYTVTNGYDEINDSRYFDKGITISFPIDLLKPKSAKTKFDYSARVWGRDVGVKSDTGTPLYNILLDERR
ncbi:YjbH domain-containing protein [Simkania negevensis]|uniref:YjbH domain-containing protein n=1 Tax=Simkania negevensis TaxID=83561 RepID=A0ABS3AS61_9BACT|nr:YjbH domain-containing protein [Simkania negevensis]